MIRREPLQSAQPSDQTLPAVWRAAAQRASVRVIVLCVGIGSAGAATLAANRFWLPAFLCVVIAAFGGYSAVIHPALGGRRLQPNTQRVLGVLAGSVAALAGAVAGLLVLAAVFGGSIEVMRR